MANQAWRAADIQGLTPAVDYRRAKGVFAIGGQNYIFDSQGPKSAFGNRLVSDFPFPLPAHVQAVRLATTTGERVFTFQGTQILEWSEVTLEWTVIYVTPDTTIVPHRWTWGHLNGKVYFCHPAAGILTYDIYTGICSKLEGPGVPLEPIGICIDNGRLNIFDAEFRYWSAQGNGADLTPRLGGAGAQKIVDIVAGDPIMIQSYSRGTLLWTTGGLMRSEFTGDEVVYRHRHVETEFRPINSFCSFKMDNNTCVILDRRGLFKSSGEAPEPMTPLFNEFLIGYLRANKVELGQNVRLEWDDLSRLLYVSVSQTFASPLYEKAFVLYPPLDKWGSFDESHYGIIPIRFATSEREGNYFGFVGSDSKIRYWKPTGSRETSLGVLAPLDAKIQVGLVRIDSLGDSNDQLSEVNQVMIGNVVTGEAGILAEDFNLIPEGQDEDYNLIAGTEDFGLERVNYINHKTRIVGTVDGTTLFDSQEAELYYFTKAARYYSCTVSGVWHILELRADEVGEMFHLRAFELTATYAGRLG